MNTFIKYKIQDNKVVEDSDDVQKVNDFEIGYNLGQMAFNDGKSVDQCLQENATVSLDIRRGITKGFFDASPVEDCLSLKDASAEYAKAKTKDNFAKVVKAYVKHVSDDDKADNLDIVDTEEGPVLGVSVSKEDLEAVKELLDADPELKIIAQDDETVTLSSDVQDSLDKLYRKSVIKVAGKHGYVCVGSHIFDVEGNCHDDYKTSVKKVR